MNHTLRTAKLALLLGFAMMSLSLAGCAGLGNLAGALGGGNPAGGQGGAGGLGGLLGGGNPAGALAGAGGAPGALAPGATAPNGLTGQLAGGLPGATPAAPGATTAAVTVPAGNDPANRQFCQKFLDKVNAYRTQLGRAPAQFDEQIFQGCLQRTPALANGMDNHAGFNVPQDGATGECLADGTDPATAADMYYSEGPGGGHYELMYGAATTRIAAATGLRASVARCR